MKKESGFLDILVGGGIIVYGVYYLMQVGLASLSVWLLLIAGIASYGLKLPITAGAILGIVTVYVVALMSKNFLLEKFDNPSKSEKAKKDEPEPASSDPHLDAGTTILHAYRKLDPEQVVQMRKDTQELMETQKNLISTLAGLGPQIKQGAELINTFKTTFGGDVLKKAVGGK